jgi:hypothetical protein
MSYQILDYNFSKDLLTNVYFDPLEQTTRISFQLNNLYHTKVRLLYNIFPIPSLIKIKERELTFIVKGHILVPTEHISSSYQIVEDQHVISIECIDTDRSEYTLTTTYLFPHLKSTYHSSFFTEYKI